MKVEVSLNLILSCLDKNPKAQKELYQKLLPTMMAICRRYLWNKNETQDVLQESFISLFKSLKQYDINKASFKTWVSRITINVCLAFNKGSTKNSSTELIINLHEPSINPNSLDSMSDEEIIKYLEQMPFPYFQIFNLFFFDGFTHREISEMLDIKVSLSRKRLARAKEWLNKTITDKNEFCKNYIFKQ